MLQVLDFFLETAKAIERGFVAVFGMVQLLSHAFFCCVIDRRPQ